MKKKEYLHEWGLPETHAAHAVSFAGMTKDVAEAWENWIWEPEKSKDGFSCDFKEIKRG